MTSPMNGGKESYVSLMLHENLDSYIARGEDVLERLKNAVKTLPVVDKDGKSECDFAEQLYAQKEEAEEKLVLEIRRQREFLPTIQQELRRTGHNLSIVRSNSSSLSNMEPKETLSKAVLEEEARLKKVEEQQRKINDLLQRMNSALAMSRAKKFPGRTPRKPQAGFSSAPSSTSFPETQPSGFGVGSPCSDRTWAERSKALDQGLDGLKSLGPLDEFKQKADERLARGTDSPHDDLRDANEGLVKMKCDHDLVHSDGTPLLNEEPKDDLLELSLEEKPKDGNVAERYHDIRVLPEGTPSIVETSGTAPFPAALPRETLRASPETPSFGPPLKGAQTGSEGSPRDLSGTDASWSKRSNALARGEDGLKSLGVFDGRDSGMRR